MSIANQFRAGRQSAKEQQKILGAVVLAFCAFCGVCIFGLTALTRLLPTGPAVVAQASDRTEAPVRATHARTSSPRTTEEWVDWYCRRVVMQTNPFDGPSRFRELMDECENVDADAIVRAGEESRREGRLPD